MKKYFYLLLFVPVLFSCKKEQDLGKLEETIYVRNDGADMPVYMRGNVSSNVVILIVHGGPGGNGWEYRAGKWSEELENKYAMAYWDQRGQGMSHGHHGNATVQQMADDMQAVVTVLKAKYGSDISVFALGHSWGGTLSAKYMLTNDYQHSVKGWIEADGAHDIPKLNKDAIRMFKSEANIQIGLGNNVANWQSILDWASGIDTNNISTDQGGEINSNAQKVEGWLLEDGIIQKGEGGGNTSSTFFDPVNPITSSVIGSQTSNALLNEIENTALTDQLSQVTIPTLILWGKYDFVVPPTLGQDCYNNISSTVKKIVIFEKSGHSPMDNEWEQFVDEVVLFVEANK